MDKALFAALKPGGFLVIADHSARPEDGATVGKTYHRIAETDACASEIEAAGFKFVADGEFPAPSGGHADRHRVPQSDAGGRIRSEIPEASVNRLAGSTGQRVRARVTTTVLRIV